MTLSVFYYDILLLMGLVVSFEDWREKKIRNKWIFSGLALVLGGYGYLFINSMLGYSKHLWMGMGEIYLPWSFYPMAAGHAALVVVTGLLTWWLRLWPAGDAKLYILFGMLVALVDHNIRGFPYLVFLKLLINIFVPAGLWVLATVLVGSALSLPGALFRSLRPIVIYRAVTGFYDRTTKRMRDIWPYRYGFLVYFLNIAVMFFTVHLIENRFAAMSFLKGPLGRLMLMGAMFLVWDPISRVFKGKKFWRSWVVLLAWWLMDPPLREIDMFKAAEDALITVVIFGILLTALRTAVGLILRRESEETLDAENLAPGMILSQSAWESLRDFGRERDEEAPGRYADGLFPDEVAKLKSWKEVPKFVVTVYRSTPFAFWVFYGTLLTLLVPKNAVYWLFRICYDPDGAVLSYFRLWGL